MVGAWSSREVVYSITPQRGRSIQECDTLPLPTAAYCAEFDELAMNSQNNFIAGSRSKLGTIRAACGLVCGPPVTCGHVWMHSANKHRHVWRKDRQILRFTGSQSVYRTMLFPDAILTPIQSRTTRNFANNSPETLGNDAPCGHSHCKTAAVLLDTLIVENCRFDGQVGYAARE